MREFLATRECLMAFLTRELDDPDSHPCGRCANCTTSFVPTEADADLTREALEFLKRSYLEMEPRKQWPTGKKIAEGERVEPGRALCYYGDAGHGASIRRGKYQDHRFGDDLVRALVDLVRNTWRPEPAPEWVTAVPSLRRPRLVPDFAERVAADLGLPYRPALQKVHDTPEQKTMENSAHQAGNVAGSFAAVKEQMASGPVLLIDDMVDSRWTLTECARVLRGAGSGPVFPIVLANSSGGDDD
jgi:ATP-dependent DNA helicase RecQ